MSSQRFPDKNSILTTLTTKGGFHFQRLMISGISNRGTLEQNDSRMAEEEICLFHSDFSSGDDYLTSLHRTVSDAVSNRLDRPIIRFADGEYAFYRQSLGCNGLYRQAESKRAIRKIMPDHVSALKWLSLHGIVAPLVFPGNVSPEPKKWFSLFSSREGSSIEFLRFLSRNGIELSGENYIPFYVVYAYLTSRFFSELVNGKRICIVNSEFNEEACRSWFERRSSRPFLSFVKTPDSYVATRWPLIESEILRQIPNDTDICLVGAGVGALLVAVGMSRALSIPCIDAGHVLNMMNGRLDKSNGPRLYTFNP